MPFNYALKSKKQEKHIFVASVDIIKLPVLFFGHIGCDAPGMLNQTYTSGCYTLWLLQLLCYQPSSGKKATLHSRLFPSFHEESRPTPSCSELFLLSLWTHLCVPGDQYCFTGLTLFLSHSLLGLRTNTFLFPSLMVGTSNISYPYFLLPQLEVTKLLWSNQREMCQWNMSELRKPSEKAWFSRLSPKFYSRYQKANVFFPSSS